MKKPICAACSIAPVLVHTWDGRCGVGDWYSCQPVQAQAKLGLFARALAALEEGRPVTRAGWPPQRVLRLARTPQEAGFPDASYVPADLPLPTYVIEEPDGSRHLGWTPERGDLAAGDWCLA
jgi:hypothetical protein